MTARSNQPSLNGSCSAGATLTVLIRSRASAAISADGSTPQTREPRSASAAATRPVPQPMSSTRRPSRSPSRTRSSNSSHHLASAGRSSSYLAATRPKSGSVDELLRFRERLDGVLRRLEGRLRDQHLLWSVLGPARVMVDRDFELRLDPGRAEDRLQLF